MTPNLRKYHRRIWFFLAGLLPILLVAAIAVIPAERTSPSTPDNQPEALPKVVKTASSDLLVATLRQDSATGERQVEIELKQALTNPSTLVYLIADENADPATGKLLGSLSSRKIYRLDAGKNLSGQEYLLLFDPITHLKIATLKL
ncbi:MAG: hypothetical protein GC192_04275 [Bacteroidetes bacterium]|nr:hypothetical protein [Bacteroidota bacterium]